MVRLRQWVKQEKICPLCERPIERENTVLDHDHATGECRATLHRGCNALLGKVENGRNINGLQDDAAWETYLNNLFKYMKSEGMGIFHPSHKSLEEKRELRNKRVRTKRRRVNKAKGESLKGVTSFKGESNE